MNDDRQGMPDGRGNNQEKSAIIPSLRGPRILPIRYQLLDKATVVDMLDG
jgi:hypothetical protein